MLYKSLSYHGPRRPTVPVSSQGGAGRPFVKTSTTLNSINQSNRQIFKPSNDLRAIGYTPRVGNVPVARKDLLELVPADQQEDRVGPQPQVVGVSYARSRSSNSLSWSQQTSRRTVWGPQPQVVGVSYARSRSSTSLSWSQQTSRRTVWGPSRR
ncbi:hypothetical protein ACJJTC_008635 [Scirpophaga incertulas]